MLILASASPRRRELLTQAGFEFIVEPSALDETALPHEAAASYVQRLAVEKAQAVLARPRELREPILVLAADTVVVVPGLLDHAPEILGKPRDAADASRMLALLSGRTHAVMTGVAAVSSSAPGEIFADVEITQVTMNRIAPQESAAYIASGEPMDKAGAYAIQGYAARWIPRIEGCYFNVVGLPIARVVALLAEAAQASLLRDPLN